VEARGREVLRADAQPKTTHSALNGWTKPENAAQQHFDILARDRVSGDWLIIELKRAKATPDAVLQTTDYLLALTQRDDFVHGRLEAVLIAERFPQLVRDLADDEGVELWRIEWPLVLSRVMKAGD